MTLRDAQVLIWGLGRHGGGLAAARFCVRQGARVRILDRLPLNQLGVDGDEAHDEGFENAVGDANHPWFRDVDIVVPSPAIPPRAWPAQHPRMCSPEALAFAAHTGPRVAVTGTKGKSTTARILGELLGWSVAGNSNEPILNVLQREGDDTPLVCELSSFQLHYLAETSPRFAAAIMTNLSQDHLDWHPDLAHYQATKCALLEWSNTFAIGPGLPEHFVAKALPAVAVTPEYFLAPDGAVLASRADLTLLGDHNAANAALALAVADQLGQDRSGFAESLRRVSPLPHRLETVHVGSRTWIDDSIATTPESAMAAMAAIIGPLGIILGGADKGASWDRLAARVVERQAVVATIGATGPALATAIRNVGGTVIPCEDLTTAVQSIHAQAPSGATVVLSPACSSLDQFTSFEERGRRFAALARAQDS